MDALQNQFSEIKELENMIKNNNPSLSETTNPNIAQTGSATTNHKNDFEFPNKPQISKNPNNRNSWRENNPRHHTRKYSNSSGNNDDKPREKTNDNEEPNPGKHDNVKNGGDDKNGAGNTRSGNLKSEVEESSRRDKSKHLDSKKTEEK